MMKKTLLVLSLVLVLVLGSAFTFAATSDESVVKGEENYRIDSNSAENNKDRTDCLRAQDKESRRENNRDRNACIENRDRQERRENIGEGSINCTEEQRMENRRNRDNCIGNKSNNQGKGHHQSRNRK